MADGVHGGNDHIGVLVQDKHSQRGRVAADLSGRVEDDKCAGGAGRKDAKYLAQTFSLPDVQVGSIIEYDFNYNFEDNYIFASDWILSEELFTKKEVFSLKPYTRFPWNVHWVWPAGLPPGTKPPEQGPDQLPIESDVNKFWKNYGKRDTESGRVHRQA
jgi:hypothetical protein